MLNTKQILHDLDLGQSRIAAIQAVRLKIEQAKDPLQAAKDIVVDILGILVNYEDPEKARLVAQAVVDESWQRDHNIIDEQELLTKCEARVTAFMADPANAWMSWKVKPVQYEAVQTTNQQVTTLVDNKVAVKKDGTMKKGGKQELALALYKKFVLDVKPEEALDNKGFIAMLMKELDMTILGARTYAYNCRQALGEPVGGLRKAKSGKKSTKQ